MNEFLPKVIKKRDGKVAPFNIERIKTAIFKAARWAAATRKKRWKWPTKWPAGSI